MLLHEIQSRPKDVQASIKAKISQEEAPLTEEKEATGNLNDVEKLLLWISQAGMDLKEKIHNKDIRNARLYLYEMERVIAQVKNHVNEIAKQIGLPKI